MRNLHARHSFYIVNRYARGESFPEFADDVIMEAGLENDGAYTAVGYYPFEQMHRLLGVLVEKTGKSTNELLYDFGITYLVS